MSITTIGWINELLAEVLDLSAEAGGQEGKHLEIACLLQKIHKGIDDGDMRIGELCEENERLEYSLDHEVKTKARLMRENKELQNELNKTNESPIESAIRAGGKQGENYITLTKTKKDVLRHILKSTGNKISGTKTDLINRILELKIPLPD